MKIQLFFKIILCLSLMTGCNTNTLFNLSSQTSIPPDSRAIIPNKNIIIQAPDGFCLDETVSDTSSKSTFLLFGNCAAISQSNSVTQSKVYAVLTAAISKEKSKNGQFNEKQLDDYLRSENGKSTLSFSGNSQDIKVLDSFKMDDSYFVLVQNIGKRKSNALSSHSWRAYLEISGYLISLSIIGFNQNPMKHDESLEIIRHFVNEIRTNNGFKPTSVPIS